VGASVCVCVCFCLLAHRRRCIVGRSQCRMTIFPSPPPSGRNDELYHCGRRLSITMATSSDPGRLSGCRPPLGVYRRSSRESNGLPIRPFVVRRPQRSSSRHPVSSSRQQRRPRVLIVCTVLLRRPRSRRTADVSVLPSRVALQDGRSSNAVGHV